jgi:hypothetical protein
MSNRFTKLLTAAVLIGAPATVLATPRTLPSGAPACGNTMGKGGYDDDCTDAERAQWRAERLRQRNLEIQHERARRAAAKQREATKALALEAKQTFVQLVSAVLPPRTRS